MTEVALGLSMAFFSLLILALLSITAGNHSSNTVNPTDTLTEQAAREENATQSLLQQNRLSLSDAQSREQQDSEASAEQTVERIRFIFHYRGQYYDADLRPQALSSINPDKTTVVAVEPNLSFSKVMEIHRDFKDKQIQITSMDENWLKAFAERM